MTKIDCQADVLGLFFPMNDFQMLDKREGKFTPLRASFNKHPGKLNCDYKDANIPTPVAISAFMSQYTKSKEQPGNISNTGNTLYYNPFGTVSPEKNYLVKWSQEWKLYDQFVICLMLKLLVRLLSQFLW